MDCPKIYKFFFRFTVLNSALPKYAVGSKTHTINAAQTVSNISFPNAFSSDPKVFLSINNPGGVRIETWVRNVSTTGFIAVIFSEGITANINVTIQWLAIE